MSHLTPEELLDLAEGTRTEATASPTRIVSHLATCAACRDQLADLQATLAMVEPIDGGVPEPSPLFWEHFSARVRQTIASEAERNQRSWTQRWLPAKVMLPAAACLVALLATAVTFRTTSAPPVPVEHTAVSPVSDAVTPPVDDPSWSLIADLAGDLDWDAAVEAGLTPAAGDVDRAIVDLSADERRELRRLLQEELSRSGV